MIPIIFSSVTDGEIIIDFAFDHFLSIVCFFISIGDQRRAEDTVRTWRSIPFSKKIFTSIIKLIIRKLFLEQIYSHHPHVYGRIQ